MTFISKVYVVSQSQYGIYTTEIKSPNAFHDRYLIQTDDVDIEFSQIFTQYIKSIHHQNSQKQIQYSQIMYSHLSIAIHLY